MTPDAYTIQEFFLEVGDGHQLYVQEWGNTKAKTPILFLHGGPGGSVQDKHRRLFDPKQQRVIFFDQRGCGRSLPYGLIKANTTKHLVEDIEKIAVKLGVKEFIITGGSWGCTLALAFSLAHPRRVKAMVLNGILTGSQSETDWVDKGGFRNFFPDIWEEYLRQTPKAHQTDPSAYHFQRALGDDEAAAKASIYAYENVEAALLQLDDRYYPESFEDYDPAGMRIEIHYLVNRFFLPDRYVFYHANRLTMPVYLVQGRYDVLCPPVSAYELHKALPNGHLIWTVSGHKTERESWTVIRTLLQQLTQGTK